MRLRAVKDGPIVLEVDGNIKTYVEGQKASEMKAPIALCRCCGSKNQPFCDGSHTKIKFTGKEADFENEI